MLKRTKQVQLHLYLFEQDKSQETRWKKMSPLFVTF